MSATQRKPARAHAEQSRTERPIRHISNSSRVDSHPSNSSTSSSPPPSRDAAAAAAPASDERRPAGRAAQCANEDGSGGGHVDVGASTCTGHGTGRSGTKREAIKRERRSRRMKRCEMHETSARTLRIALLFGILEIARLLFGIRDCRQRPVPSSVPKAGGRPGGRRARRLARVRLYDCTTCAAQ